MENKKNKNSLLSLLACILVIACAGLSLAGYEHPTFSDTSAAKTTAGAKANALEKMKELTRPTSTAATTSPAGSKSLSTVSENDTYKDGTYNVFTAGQTYTITVTSNSSKVPYSFSYTCPVTLTEDSVALGAESMAYTGKAIVPAITVKAGDAVLAAGKDYTVTAENNVNVGTATVTVTGMDDYTGSVSKTFNIVQAAQKITTKVTTKTYKYTTVKKKAQSFAIGATAKTSLSYKSSNSKVTVTKAGKVTVKKGTKKGTYKIYVTAAANDNYKAASKVVYVKVK